MENHPFVSVIVPVKNFERTIEKSFEYILKVDYPHDRWEIIFADGGSTDKTVAIIKEWQKKHPFLKLVEIPDCPSPGFARNKALAVVKGDFIFFTDADCAPCKDWITLMLAHFKRDPEIAAVGGEVFTLRVDPDNLVEAWCQHFRFNMVSPRYGFIKEGYYPDFPKEPMPSDIAGHKAYFFGTCNVAYRKAAMEKIGAKFWDLPTGEDMDLTYQHRSKGWRYYFAPDAKVDHMHRADLKSLLRVWASYGHAHALLINKYVKKNGLEVIFQFLNKKPSVFLPLPCKGFVYIGNFHLMHIFGLVFILGLIFRWGAVNWASPALAVYYAHQYVKWNFSMEPKSRFFTWCRMKYLTNLSFIKGGLKDFKKYRIFCIEPSF